MKHIEAVFEPDGKEDRRTRYTKMVLAQSLLALLQEKEIGQITVTEICREADINRNTFYRYYYGPEHLLSTIEDRFMKIITLAISTPDDIDSMSRDLLGALLDNKELSRLVFSGHGGGNLMKKILQSTREQFLEEWKRKVGPVHAGRLEKIYLFGEGGMIAIVTNWIQNDFREDPDEIVSYLKLADTLIRSELQQVL